MGMKTYILFIRVVLLKSIQFDLYDIPQICMYALKLFFNNNNNKKIEINSLVVQNNISYFYFVDVANNNN